MNPDRIRQIWIAATPAGSENEHACWEQPGNPAGRKTLTSRSLRAEKTPRIRTSNYWLSGDLCSGKNAGRPKKKTRSGIEKRMGGIDPQTVVPKPFELKGSTAQFNRDSGQRLRPMLIKKAK